MSVKLLIPRYIQPSNPTTVTGQQQYTTAGTYSLVVPAGVYSLSVVLVAGGQGGGSWKAGDGGKLRYKNNIPVTPGETLTIIVGNGSVGTDASTPTTPGGITSLKRGAVVIFDTNSTIGVDADGGGDGGIGGYGKNVTGTYGSTFSGGGAGGAGGYSGNGGDGGTTATPAGQNGNGGGGGGGATTTTTVGVDSGSGYTFGRRGANGGGVGLLGQGANGTGGTASSSTANAGTGGSGGATGGASGGGNGGASGGGGAAGYQRTSGVNVPGDIGGVGGARLIWGTMPRTFPSTNTGNM